ncbi:hypothetical protein BC831DRAFT_382371, partial [Entophlyctis helioformis]
LFDMFNIRLVHGWTCDPDDQETYRIVAKKHGSYNKVVEAIVAGDMQKRTEKRVELETAVHEGHVCSHFLATTASQLSYHGLQAIFDTVRPGELCVLFRNNHFSTLFKHPQGGLFTLVTDQGFAKTKGVVWESMDRVDGNSEFYNGVFEPYGLYSDEAENQQMTPVAETDDHQAVADRDLALALSLQQEEEQQHADFLRQQENRQRQQAHLQQQQQQ